MRSQLERDETSIRIFAGLLLGVLMAAGGLGLLWIAEEVVGIRDAVLWPLSNIVLVGAVLVVVAYVHRHRRS